MGLVYEKRMQLLVKKRRIESNIEFLELAIKSKVGIRTLQMMEKGSYFPSLDILAKIACALEMNIDDLWELKHVDIMTEGVN